MQYLEALIQRLTQIQSHLALLSTAGRIDFSPTDWRSPIATEGGFAGRLCAFQPLDNAAKPSAATRKKTPEPRWQPSDVDSIVRSAAIRYGLPPALIHAVIKVESSYNPRCQSSAGAQGLMQLMPATAAALGVANPFDPVQNIHGGCRYLRAQLDAFGSVRLALAAYNAGPGAVRRYGGVPPYPETQRYVRRVMAEWMRLESKAAVPDPPVTAASFRQRPQPPPARNSASARIRIAHSSSTQPVAQQSATSSRRPTRRTSIGTIRPRVPFAGETKAPPSAYSPHNRPLLPRRHENPQAAARANRMPAPPAREQALTITSDEQRARPGPSTRINLPSSASSPNPPPVVSASPRSAAPAADDPVAQQQTPQEPPSKAAADAPPVPSSPQQPPLPEESTRTPISSTTSVSTRVLAKEATAPPPNRDPVAPRAPSPESGLDEHLPNPAPVSPKQIQPPSPSNGWKAPPPYSLPVTTRSPGPAAEPFPKVVAYASVPVELSQRPIPGGPAQPDPSQTAATHAPARHELPRTPTANAPTRPAPPPTAAMDRPALLENLQRPTANPPARLELELSAQDADAPIPPMPISERASPIVSPESHDAAEHMHQPDSSPRWHNPQTIRTLGRVSGATTRTAGREASPSQGRVRPPSREAGRTPTDPHFRQPAPQLLQQPRAHEGAATETREATPGPNDAAQSPARPHAVHSLLVEVESERGPVRILALGHEHMVATRVTTADWSEAQYLRAHETTLRTILNNQAITLSSFDVASQSHGRAYAQGQEGSEPPMAPAVAPGLIGTQPRPETALPASTRLVHIIV